MLFALALVVTQTTTTAPGAGWTPWWWVAGASILSGLGTFIVTILSGKIVVPTWTYNSAVATGKEQFEREKARADRLEAERVAKEQYEREKERADKAESLLIELRKTTDEDTIPALVRATDLNAKLSEELVRLRASRGAG